MDLGLVYCLDFRLWTRLANIKLPTISKGKNNNEVHELSKRMEDTIRRIQDNAGILGVMLYTPEGIPIKTTVDNTTAAQVYVYVTIRCLIILLVSVSEPCVAPGLCGQVRGPGPGPDQRDDLLQGPVRQSRGPGGPGPSVPDDCAAEE